MTDKSTSTSQNGNPLHADCTPDPVLYAQLFDEDLRHVTPEAQLQNIIMARLDEIYTVLREAGFSLPINKIHARDK